MIDFLTMKNPIHTGLPDYWMVGLLDESNKLPIHQSIDPSIHQSIF
jgi:hypothetical protein